MLTPVPNSDVVLVSSGDHSYAIGQSIGAGAFGTVFECLDEWGNRLVAKVIRPENKTQDDLRESWERELKNLVALRHPNITFVYDAFEEGGLYYLILERCEYSLNVLIENVNIKGDLWVEPVARCILQAVHFMHRAGYIHKDIHPGNVMASESRDEMNPNQTPTSRFKVGDLGISRLLPEIDVFNTIVAKWMLPPEFLSEDFGKVSWNVDVYHCALLLLSLSLGRIPTFTPDEILDGLPRQMAEDLQSPYSGALSTALRRHVDARTPTALEFWKQIHGAGIGIDWEAHYKNRGVL